MRRRRTISMLVDSEFHKKINDERIKMEKIIGKRLTNTKITSMIALSGQLKLNHKRRKNL